MTSGGLHSATEDLHMAKTTPKTTKRKAKGALPDAWAKPKPGAPDMLDGPGSSEDRAQQGLYRSSEKRESEKRKPKAGRR